MCGCSHRYNRHHFAVTIYVLKVYRNFIVSEFFFDMLSSRWLWPLCSCHAACVDDGISGYACSAIRGPFLNLNVNE